MNDPDIGINVAISPSDCLHSIIGEGLGKYHDQPSTYMTKNTIIPTREKLIKEPAGPPSWKALPELTSKPGPIIPFQC